MIILRMREIRVEDRPDHHHFFGERWIKNKSAEGFREMLVRNESLGCMFNMMNPLIANSV
jgi:hypothetical protein